MSLPNAVDCSRWSGELTDEEATCLAAQGIHTIIVATGPGNYGMFAAQQAAMAVKHGFTLETYHYLEWTADPAGWIKAGVTALGDNPQHVSRAWVDVEDPTVWRTLTARVAAVIAALGAADAAYPEVGICTGNWYWIQPRYMGNTDLFAARPLWNAWYDEDPDIDGLPYGGWTRASVAIEQFGGTRLLCGQSVDINYVYQPGGDMSELEDLIISVYRDPGMEDASHAEQLGNARMRMANRLAQRGSINDALESHLAAHPGGSGPHTHKPEDIPHVHPSVTGGPIPPTVAAMGQPQ